MQGRRGPPARERSQQRDLHEHDPSPRAGMLQTVLPAMKPPGNLPCLVWFKMLWTLRKGQELYSSSTYLWQEERDHVQLLLYVPPAENAKGITPDKEISCKGNSSPGLPFPASLHKLQGNRRRGKFQSICSPSVWCPAPPGPQRSSKAISNAGSEAAGAPEPCKQSFSIPTRNEGEEGSWMKINNFWLLWIKACYNQNSPPSAASALGPRSSKIICVLEATGKVSSTEKTLLVSKKGAGECF